MYVLVGVVVDSERLWCDWRLSNSADNPFLLLLFNAEDALSLSVFKLLKFQLKLLSFELVKSFLILVP